MNSGRHSSVLGTARCQAEAAGEPPGDSSSWASLVLARWNRKEVPCAVRPAHPICSDPQDHAQSGGLWPWVLDVVSGKVNPALIFIY